MRKPRRTREQSRGALNKLTPLSSRGEPYTPLKDVPVDPKPTSEDERLLMEAQRNNKASEYHH